MKRILGILAVVILAFAPLAFGQEVERILISDATDGDTGSVDAPFSNPVVYSLDPLEGGDGRSGLMTRINSTTAVILSPGGDRKWGNTDDGAIHCRNIGLATQTCEFIELGFLPYPNRDGDAGGLEFDTDGNGIGDGNSSAQEDQRGPIRVNNSTAVVVGAGELDAGPCCGNAVIRATLCEDGNSVGGSGANQNDVLFVLRGLGTANAKVEEIENLCLGTPAADPIRINDNTVIFAQPGADGEFADSSVCPADFDDEILVVRGLLPGREIKEDRLVLDGKDGRPEVSLSGSPAGVGVRVSNNVAVFSSPGEDQDYSPSLDNDCSSTDEDDGLVVVKGLATLTATPTISFVELGNLAANPSSRPALVNSANGAVIVTGPGDNADYDGNVGDNTREADNTIFVVKNLVSGTIKVDRFDDGDSPVGLHIMERAKAVNATTAVIFDTNEELDPESGGDTTGVLFAHIISNIGTAGDPKIKTIRIPGSKFMRSDWNAMHEVGLVMNTKQIIFPVMGKNQVLALTLGTRPKLGAAGGAVDDWTVPKITKINSTTAAYVVAKEGALGLLRLEPTGGLEDVRLTLGGKKGPSGQPVAVGTNKALYNIFSSGAVVVVENVTRRPIFEMIQVINEFDPDELEDTDDVFTLSAAPGARPLVFGTAGAPVVVMIGEGENGGFDAHDDSDEDDDDDELIVITDL